MKKQLTVLAVAIAAALPAVAHAGQASATAGLHVSAGAGLTFGQIDGLGLHNVGAAGVTAGVGLSASPAGIPLALTASVTRLHGAGVTEQQADASLAYVYSPRAAPGLALMPTLAIGRGALIGGAAASHAAAGLAASYSFGASSPWALSASYLRGETIDGGTGSGTGPYQNGSLAVSYAHPLGLPGNASLAYQHVRWYSDTLPSGGDQYVRSDAVTLGYSQTF
ncbi:hypothetical protein GALL_152270 [mine drainage metagenome]|uniref:Uncharacterized protein n=1 Tax=mine drainage metagenome TaxID=410659 RepID=A0A1J5SEZ5_9ZZZZ